MAKKKNKKLKSVECIKPPKKKFIKIKDKSLTLEERIYALPPYTHDFTMNRQYQLEKAGLWDKYDQQYILTTHANSLDFDTNKEYVGLFDEKIEEKFLNKRNINISKRSRVEYSPFSLQIVGGCIISSPSFIAVLKSTSGRLKDKLTMIQGHVDYDSSFVSCNDVTEFIRKNTMRELKEEVKIKGEELEDVITLSEKPKYVINKYGTLIDVEHIGFIYEASMSDEDILKLKSNEKDKHEVFIINRETLNEKGKDEYTFDSWLSDVITMMMA